MDIFKKKTVIITAAAVCSFGIHMYAYAADEPYYTVKSPQSEENGVLTLENGQKWYKVNGFEDENDYIICVKGSDGEHDADARRPAPDGHAGGRDGALDGLYPRVFCGQPRPRAV